MAGFIHETIQGVGGAVPLADGYLPEVYKVGGRAAGPDVCTSLLGWCLLASLLIPKFYAGGSEAAARRSPLCSAILLSLNFSGASLPPLPQTVREAGGVCIADEVQTGFGRTGSHFWGFETQVLPDAGRCM